MKKCWVEVLHFKDENSVSLFLHTKKHTYTQHTHTHTESNCLSVWFIFISPVLCDVNTPAFKETHLHVQKNNKSNKTEKKTQNWLIQDNQVFCWAL